ncbi:sulfurtransferase [Cellvibrio japonicus]|uniref:Rhodanese n=1 Tax=Cellvibrio japonicus (strain Ueda107) TaxID=498211 RepID=B3PDR6_CELJU|nr:rhodanese-like domain-containing protein [Cellvibrio japonicus]ACE84454.1 rhodanese [Cellvibrio japonicus Ueda107]QEI13406.1 sulfurtransferase [Cellvibrio japonicus]QEI16980.1 sulfurtransferase [Cellvibrio japonicus]QEI20558.1 sulfurtransferase [Cellvibrio japonicus]
MPLPFIMEPTELAALLAQPCGKLLILDLGAEQTYRTGHIDGAVHVPAQKIVCAQPPVPGKIASKEQLEKLFSFLGLTPDTHVVVYDDEGGGWAGRMIWTLDAIGHKQYSYLNGGLHAWMASGQSLTTEVPVVTPTQVNIKIDPKVVIEIPDILGEMDRADFVVWDARSPAEYSGERITAQKNGHIPGAINCEWTNLMDPNQALRIRTDARDYVTALGFTPDKRIITHCQGHHRSGFTYLVGKALGLNIRAYHGSWAEWGNHPTTPVVQTE